SGRLRTTHSASSTVETWAPRARSALAISSVSRARSGWLRVLDPTESAERTRARAVIDFDPGSRTVWRTGRLAVGAGQPAPAGAGGVTTVSATALLCAQ